MTEGQALTLLREAIGNARTTRRDPDWNRYAQIYDETVGELAPYERLIARVAELATSGIVEGRNTTFVDAATGTGNLLSPLLSLTHRARIIGVENAPGMLARLKMKFTGSGRVTILEGDLNGSGWVEVIGEGKADVVVSVNTLYTMTHPLAFLRDARRVLRPGGRFVLSNPTTRELSPIMIDHLLAGGALTPLMIEMIEINMDITHWGVQSGMLYHFLPAENVFDLLKVAGFSIEAWKSDYAGVNITTVCRAF